MFGMSVKLNGSVIHYLKYRKVSIISPGLIFVQKAVLLAYFRGSLFSEGLIIGRTFAFQNGFGLTIKTASVKHYENNLKQLKTASNNKLITVRGLLFGRAYCRDPQPRSMRAE